MKTLIRPLKWSCAALLAVALPAVAQTTDTWSGAADANWSTAGNWTPGVPSAGDNLIFDVSGQLAPNNDLTADTLFNNLTFAPTAPAFTLGGNEIWLQGTVENDATNQLQTIAQALVLTNTVTFNTVSNDLNQVSGNDIAVVGNVTGPGALIKTGAGTLTLSSIAHSGGTTVNGGLLVVSNNNANYTMNGGSLLLNFRTYYTGMNVPFTADSSVGIDLLDNAEPRGVDAYGTFGSPGYQLTKIGQGILRIVGGINAGSIDVAEGTLGSLGGGLGGSAAAEPLHKWGTAPITVENGAMLRADDGGVVPNAITLNGGDGTSVGSYQHLGVLISSSRNNGASTTNFNYFTNTITLAADSTVGSYFNKMFISGNLTGPGGFTKIGTQPLNISGTNDFGGVLIASAGTLQLGSATALPSGPTNSYVQVANSATLDLNGNNASCNGFIDDGAGMATLDNSAATPATLTFGNNSSSASFYGAVNNSGGGALSLVYVGGNTASFLGVNTYSGSNVVSAGTLDINIPTGTTTGGLVAVADTATLSLHYRVPGSSLKAAGATFGASGATALTVDLNNYGNPTPPVINATNGTGVLSANGTITITFNNTANLSVGTFPIIRYTTRTGGGSFVLTPIAGIGAKIVTNTAAGNNYIGLQITSAPITTWKGKTNNNVWDTTTTNWTYSGSPVLYSDGSAVFFDDTALTNIVNLATALSPGSVLLNSTNTYIFSGAGALSGGALTKNGSGTLILDVVGNSYASTTIGGGTLQVGNNDNQGDLGSGNVDDEGTLIFNLTNNYTVPGVISGAGTVVQNNTNTVTLSQADTFTGGTTVNKGILKLGNISSLGNPAGSVIATVASGASLDLGGQKVGLGYVSISGNGVSANVGALLTTAGMGCSIGCTPVGVKYLRLAGDASIGDSSGDFQLGTNGNANGGVGVCSIDGQGHSLTKVGNNTLILEGTNFTALSQFVLAGGQLIYANTAKTPLGTTATLVISNNASMDSWDNFANSGITVPNNLVIGAGGGQVWNTRGMFYGHACYNTYSGSVTLNGTLALRNTSTYGGSPNNVATSGTMIFSGPISGPSGISCTNGHASTAGGATTINTVTLTGANTYNGATVVNQGVLQLSAIQQGGGAYLVFDNSTLDVPTQTGFSNMPMSSLTLGSVSGGTLNLGRITALSTTSAPIYATNLTVIGTNSILLPPVAYASAAGEYPLIKYITGPSGYGTTALIAIGGGVRGVNGYITNDTANSQIAFVIPGGTPVVWTGTANNTWDISTSLDWVTNLVATTYQQPGSLGDAVTFDDSSSVTNVNVSVPVTPTVAIFNLTNKNYTLSGTNITGAASLVKNGAGTLVLSNLNNNFTGGTIVNGGTLRTATGVTALNNLAGTVTVNSGATLDMGSNNLTTLVINASGSGVAGAGAIQANFTGAQVAQGVSAVNQSGNLVIGGNNRWDVRNNSKLWNVNSNGATLTKVGAGYVGLNGVTVSTNLGDITILGGTLSYQAASTGLGNTNNTIYVGNGAALGFNSATIPLFKNIVCSNGAAISSDGGNSTSLNIISSLVKLDSGTVNLNFNFYNSATFSNTISGAGGLSMQFQSFITLAASNTYTGVTTVPRCNSGSGGLGTRLSLIGNGSILNSSQIVLQGLQSGQAFAAYLDVLGRADKTLTLGTNQILRGDNGAFIRGSVVAVAGSAIIPGGISTNYQYMSISNNLTFQTGSTNNMDIYKAGSFYSNDIINVSNVLTLGGSLVVATNGALNALAAGDSFKLFYAGSYTGSFSTITPAPGPGLVWDASQLAISGTLSVKAVSVSPTSTSIAYGNNVTLTASSTLTSPTYQWFDNATNAIGGATSAALTLTKPAVAASGNYTCAISKNGATSTVVAALTVTPAALSITATNISKNFGTTYTFNGTEFVSSGLVAGDSITSVSLASAGAASGAAVNTYPIVPSSAIGSGLANYNIAYNNGTMTVVQTVNLGRTNIVTSVNGNTLTLSWPADHIGWTLQSNSVGLANSGAWFDVPGSATTNQVNILFDPTQPNVFYRMKY